MPSGHLNSYRNWSHVGIYTYDPGGSGFLRDDSSFFCLLSCDRQGPFLSLSFFVCLFGSAVNKAIRTW